MTLKTIRRLFYAASSFVHHFLAIGEFKLELQSGNTQFGSNRRFVEPCELKFLWMTLKNNRAPLLKNIKLYASFHHHMWIQTGVTVREQLRVVMTSVTLIFDLWTWPFAWTSPLSLVITPENFVMIRWQEHSEKGVTVRQTDRKRCSRAAWSQLKSMENPLLTGNQYDLTADPYSKCFGHQGQQKYCTAVPKNQPLCVLKLCYVVVNGVGTCFILCDSNFW